MKPLRARFDVAGATALMIGATGIGLAPILVRLSETGPVATAFYRIVLAQPIVWLLLRRQTTNESGSENRKRDFWYAALAGLFFALDLGIWHWSIRLTTIANSTFFANFAPFFVMIGANVLFGEKVAPRLMIGMLIALCGGFLLVAESFNLEWRFLLGDILAVAAAIFYAGYLLVVKQLRRGRSTWYVMAWTGLFSSPVLLAVSAASHEALLPKTSMGWVIILTLALVSHIGGQGMIAYGLAHISASISAVMLMWQPVVAALLAVWMLHEPLTPLRAAGGAVIIAGILLGTWRRGD